LVGDNDIPASGVKVLVGNEAGYNPEGFLAVPAAPALRPWRMRLSRMTQSVTDHVGSVLSLRSYKLLTFIEPEYGVTFLDQFNSIEACSPWNLLMFDLSVSALTVWFCKANSQQYKKLLKRRICFNGFVKQKVQ
jgi:hypothetical protein